MLHSAFPTERPLGFVSSLLPTPVLCLPKVQPWAGVGSLCGHREVESWHWADWFGCGQGAYAGLAFPRELNRGDKGHLGVHPAQCRVCSNVFMALPRAGSSSLTQGGSRCQDCTGSCLLLFPRGPACSPPGKPWGSCLVRSAGEGKPGSACLLGSHAVPAGSAAVQAVKAEPVRGLLGDQ